MTGRIHHHHWHGGFCRRLLSTKYNYLVKGCQTISSWINFDSSNSFKNIFYFISSVEFTDIKLLIILLVLLFISVKSMVMSSFSFLILRIYFSLFFFLINLAGGLSTLLIFSKYMNFYSPLFLFCILFMFNLIFIISFLYFTFNLVFFS